MLEHIKANVSKQCDQNKAAADKIRDLLKDYEAKLKDLDEALKEAVDLVKKANTQNGLNAQALKDLLVMAQSNKSVIRNCYHIKFTLYSNRNDPYALYRSVLLT